MGISLNPEHLIRYKEIAQLFLKYGRSDLLTRAGLDEVLSEQERAHSGKTAAQATALADDLERMGPIFIKLGQVLSSRSDLLPPAYLDSLARLQDDLAPFAFDEVERIVEDELGVRLSKAFSAFDPKPVGAASLAQVHRAALRDGRPVAVKVQRPGIRKTIANDLEALARIAEFADAHLQAGRKFRFTEILEEFKRDLARELDFGQEARHLTQIGESLREYPGLVVPRPVDDYCSSRVLTMEFIHGRKITSVGPLAALEVDMRGLAEQLFKGYLKQILVDGVFHADPHPGNLMLTDDGRIALVDLGMVGYLAPRMQEQLLRLLIAISEGRSDEAADHAIKIGQTTDQFDEVEFRRRVADLVAQQRDSTVSNMRIGSALLEFSRVTGDSGIRMPSSLTMFSKTLMNLDEAGRALDPEFNPNEAIRRNAAEILRQRLYKSLTPGHLFNAAMEAREFVEEMPMRINRILDAASKNEFQIRVKAIDESTLIDGFQKVANRITTGLILASLIVGASMLMRVETRFQVLGYPGLAMICFIAAAGGGLGLVVTILLRDRDPRPR